MFSLFRQRHQNHIETIAHDERCDQFKEWILEEEEETKKKEVRCPLKYARKARKKIKIPRVGCRINLDRSNRHTEKQRAFRKLVSGEHCCSCCSPTAVFFVFSIAIARLNFEQSCNCFSVLPMRNKYSELVSEQMKLSVDG